MVWPTKHDVKLDEYDAMELPGQQLTAAHALTPLDHLLNLDFKKEPGCVRLTGIIATMGKSTYDVETMEKMMAAGMNIALINCCFGRRREHIQSINMLRQAARNYSITMGKKYPLCIAIRLNGRKIRTGRIAETYGETVELRTGEMVRLTTDDTYKERCSVYAIFIDFLNITTQINKGDNIYLDNEIIMLRVEAISATTVTCKVEKGGILGSYKDVIVPDVEFKMPNYSEKDRSDIEMAIDYQVDTIIVSTPSSGSCITELRSILGAEGKKISIIANIPNRESFLNFDDILKVADGIMITRQELGLKIMAQTLVIAQKNMIARANKANVPISVNAQLLSNMSHQKTPHRTELLDITNCILDGADALVLSAEVAIGEFPVETVQTMARVCKEAEVCVWTKQVFYELVEKTPIPCNQMMGCALGAVLASQRLMAAAIVVVTKSVNSAMLVAKYRPRCPIMAVTRHANIARQLHFWRGIMPLIYEAPPDPDWQADIDKRVFYCTKWGMAQGFIRVGDPIVVVSGWMLNNTLTNTVRVTYAALDASPP